MSKSNENNPHTIQIPLGTQSNISMSVPGVYARKKMVIKRVTLLTSKTIAAATHVALVQLKNGTNLLAEINTLTANEGAVTPLVGKVAPETEIDVAAGSTLHVGIQTTGTGAVENGVLELEAYYN